jgi:ankyrin repeat protein
VNRNKLILVATLWCSGAMAADVQLLALPAAHVESSLQAPAAPAVIVKVQYSADSILKTWALKNLLTSAPEQDLYQSPLLGIIAVENGTIKNWYGEFTDSVGDNNRFKRTFASETPSELVTRAFFDQLDGKIRCATLGSNPTIALTAHQVGHLVKLVKTKGIKEFIRVFGKRDGKLPKKGAPESAEQKEQGEFLKQWFAVYQLRTEPGKFSDLGRLRRWMEGVSEQLNLLVTLQGEEAIQKQFLTLLMSYLYLKDFKEAEKNPEYSIAYYFKALGVDYYTAFYTQVDKKELEKKIKEGKLGETSEALEDMVFYMASLVKNAYNFLEQPFVNIDYPPSDPHDIPICAETTARSLFNVILYNFSKGTFDFSLLPDEVQKTVDGKFKTFFENHANPLVPNYYSATIFEWMDFLVTDVPGLPHGKFKYDLLGTPSVLLRLCNYVFGTQAATFEELGKKLSTATHTIVFGPYDKKAEQFFLEVTDKKTDSTVQANIIAKSTGHTVFNLQSDSIMSLLGSKAFSLLVNLQGKYGIVLIPIAFTPQTVNAKNSRNYAPVYLADYDALKALLENGAFPDTPSGEFNTTPLGKAASKGSLSIARLLLEHGASNMPVGMNREDSPLKIALKEGHAAVVRLMEKYGFSDDSVDSKKLLNFHRAIRKNENDRVLNFIKSGSIDVNMPNKKGETPLALAAHLKDEKIAKMLIDNGALTSINAQDPFGLTPLHQAVLAGNGKTIKLLMTYGADPLITTSEGQSALDLAREDEFVRFLPLMEKAQTQVSLVEAIKGEYRDKIEEILSVPGARTDEVDTEGNTALHAAFIKKDLKLVQRLLEYGIGTSLALQNMQGQTPLSLVIQSNFYEDEKMELVKDFVSRGASTTSVDIKGNTPLSNALAERDGEIMKYLLDHGAQASLSVRKNVGKRWVTPLESSMILVPEFQKLLLDHGADPRMLSSKTEKTLLEEAEGRQSNYPETYELFKTAAEKLEQAGIPIPVEEEDEE